MGNRTGKRSTKRVVDVGLRIKLLRSIIRKKEQEIEDELNREIELDFDLENEEVQNLESHFKQLEILLESMDEPSGSYSISSFDEIYGELSMETIKSDQSKKPHIALPMKRIREDESDDEVDQESNQQPPEKIFKSV